MLRKVRDYVSLLSCMTEKTFQVDGLLHLRDPQDWQYLFYCLVYALLAPGTIHSFLFNKFMLNFKHNMIVFDFSVGSLHRREERETCTSLP